MTEGAGPSAGVLIAVVYGICSASMAFANKAVLSTFSYNFPFALVAAQMLFTVLLLEGLRLGGAIVLPAASPARCRSFLLPSLFYGVHSVLALSALSGMNIPMYGLIKRCSPLVILVLGTPLLGKGLPSAPVCLSVAMVTLGCVIAGMGDLALDVRAYVYGVASVVSQALYLLLVQKSGLKSGQSLSAAETLHLNSVNTLPILALGWLLGGERAPSIAAFDLRNPAFLLMFAVVITMGCLLNFLLFLCTMYNSALTTSLTGSLKSILQTVIGMFTFGGIAINVFTVAGIATNLSGGVLYSLAKYAENRKKNKPEQAAKAVSNGTPAGPGVREV